MRGSERSSIIEVSVVCFALAVLCLWSLLKADIVTLQVFGFDQALKVSRGVLLQDEPGGVFYSRAITRITSDIYVVAGAATGQGQALQGAVAMEILPGLSSAKVLWRYKGDRPVQDSKDRGNLPYFRGVAATPNGAVFLCGHRPSDQQQDQPSLLTRLDASGVVLGDELLLPPLRSKNITQTKQDRPEILSDIVTGEFEDCLVWGNRIAIVGRASRFFPSQADPHTRSHNSYYWVVAVEADGEVAWQRTYPIGFDAIDELTSVLTGPDGQLLFTFRRMSETEILSIGQDGELLGRRIISGNYLLVHPSAASTIIQIVGGDPKGSKSLIRLGSGLQDMERQDGLDAPEFVISKAYGLADQSLMLFGSGIRSHGASYFSSMRYIARSGNVEGEDLSRRPFFDGGVVKIVAPTGRPGEFITARDLLEKNLGRVSRAGVALDFVNASRR